MHQDLLQLQACQNPFDDQKHKFQDRDTLKSPWLMLWGMLTKIAHFSRILLSHNPFLGQKWCKQLWTKRPSFQNYPHTEKWCFNLKGLLWHMSLPGANESKKNEKKNKRKNDCHVMHLKNSIKPKWESRMSKKNDDEKIA